MRTEDMLRTHPKNTSNAKEFAACIETLTDCANICNSCADACLGEEKIDMLRKCIRLDMDCSDVCQTTARILSRQTAFDPKYMRMQLDACASICEMCAQECEQHANSHQHCLICASVCRDCEKACRQLLSSGF
jgi:hypothetical protein